MIRRAAPIAASRSVSPGRIALLMVLAGAVAAFVYFDVGSRLTLESLQANRDALLLYAQRNFGAAVAVFIALYIAQTALSLPGGAILTLAAGFLFGALPATLIVNIGATVGATLAFLAARYLLHDWVEARFGDRLAPLQAGFARNAFHYLLTLRLIPLFPFFLVNLLSGITRIRVGTYVVATAIGIVPGSFVYAYAGRQLGAIDSLAEIASPPVLLAFTLLGALALAPVLHRRYVAGASSRR